MSNAQEETELDDGRKPCDWRTRFGKGAWLQIVAELAYLVILMVLGLSILFDGALWRVSVAGEGGMYKSVLTGWEFKNSAVNWIALWTAGLIGGTVFDLKWLYHSVAKATWNQDRVALEAYCAI